MIKLNLTANTREQTLIKEHLENNVSKILAEKINNGVKIINEDKTLINKKDLDGFMRYACEEARKQVQNKSNSACVEDTVVYGWAIHYFEEDSIEGTLYNEDGSPFTPPKKEKPKTTTTTIKAKPKEPENKQANLFDIFDMQNNTPEENKEESAEIEQLDNEELEEDVASDIEEQEFIEINNQIVNTSTGEVVELKQPLQETIDKELAEMLAGVLDCKIQVKL